LLFFSKRANDQLKPDVIVEGGGFIKKQERQMPIGRHFLGGSCMGVLGGFLSEGQVIMKVIISN
jgi:hypothetical protein